MEQEENELWNKTSRKVESGQKHLADGHEYGSSTQQSDDGWVGGWRDLRREVSQHD